MASLGDRIKARIEEVRERRPFVDHVVRTVQHYSGVKGGQQSGAMTYFGFLSVFPILALGFAMVGFLANANENTDFESDLVEAVGSVLPGLVTDDEAEAQEEDMLFLGDISGAAPGILSIGLPILLYSSLGWLSAMRDALLVMFETPRREQPNFFVGKLRDLVSLLLIGVTLIVAVSVAGLVTGFSKEILEWVGLAGSTPAGWLLRALTVVVGLAANSVLFFALFRLLAAPEIPNRALWSGALFGAIGFEALKQLSWLLLAGTENSPATQAFGIALILVVWIHYFSQLVLYAAAWAYTSESARDFQALGHERQSARDAQASGPTAAEPRRTEEESLQPAAAFALGGATMLGLVALARKTVRKGRS